MGAGEEEERRMSASMHAHRRQHACERGCVRRAALATAAMLLRSPTQDCTSHPCMQTRTLTFRVTAIPEAAEDAAAAIEEDEDETPLLVREAEPKSRDGESSLAVEDSMFVSRQVL